MNWEVIIPRTDDSQISSSITVEAENWFTALRAGLDKHGMDKELISNINCVVRQDKSVEVTDFVTNRVFTLRPLDEETPAAEAAEPTQSSKDKKRDSKVAFAKPIPAATQPAQKAVQEPEKKKAPKQAKKRSVELPKGLPAHNLFYSRDEAPEDGGGIYYRERLLAVTEATTRDESAVLARAYFEQLKAMGADPDTKLFISVQVFDHSFSTEAERPAVAALTWRQWSPKKPRILFPLSGDEGVTFSKMPPVPEPQKQPAAQPESAVAKKAPVKQKAGKPAALTSGPMEAPAAATAPQAEKPTPAKEMETSGIDDQMFEAFERMQGLYAHRDHDSAAQFVLDLAQEMIACEAGSCLLVTPGSPQLYVAAARGPFEGDILKKTIPLKRGIIGFATRSSAVVTVRDPESDPRFDPELDFRKGFRILNLICAPIQHEGRTHGVIELIDSPREEGFDQHDANILSYLGGSFGEYIENVLPSREDVEEHDEAASSARATSSRPKATAKGSSQRKKRA